MALEFPDKPDSFLVLGPNGAGISTALDIFADYDFLTVAGIDPQQLHNTVAPLSQGQKPLAFSLKLAPETDASSLLQAIQALKQNMPDLKVLCLDAPEPVLVQRYMQSEKTHPFESAGLQAAVKAQKSLFAQIKELVKDYSIDTSTVDAQELRHKIARILNRPIENQHFTVFITTFGFKYGAPQDAELVFDMRFMTNPFYDEKLRPLTGRDKPVRDFIFALDHAREFFEQWSRLVCMMLPLYQQQGKMRLNIAVGCTGGKHRSVCMAEALAAHLSEHCPGVKVVMTHREMLRWGEQAAELAVAPQCPQGEPS